MRPAPTINVRLPVRSRSVRVPPITARSASRESEIAAAQNSASTMKNEREKSPNDWVAAMYPSDTASETTTAPAIATRSREPAYRQIER